MSYADLRGLDLSGLDMTGYVLDHANCEGTIFKGTILTDVNFNLAKFSQDTSFEDATLDHASFAMADSLSWVNFQNAKMRDVQNLAGRDLRGANLEGVDLTGTNLSNAVLVRAKCGGAIFFNADITNAEVLGADFNKATGINLRMAKSVLNFSRQDGGAKWPSAIKILLKPDTTIPTTPPDTRLPKQNWVTQLREDKAQAQRKPDESTPLTGDIHTDALSLYQ